jgi:prepilin-type N-terminal cleavage/methylation domain-containing protein
MTKIFNRISEKIKRKTLRNNMPQAEVILWSKLKSKGLIGYKFRRQYSVGKFVIDFYCPKLKLAIEIDGDSHFAEGADIYDSEWQKMIESFGITFLRFTNREIYENIENVLENIAKHMKPSLTPPYIPPLGKGRLVGHIPPLSKGKLGGVQGFTLIELMVVVVIIVVLIAIAGTTWLLSLNHLSLRNDATDIKGALQKAKQRTVTTGRPHQVYFDITNEVYQIEDCNLGANDPPNECNTAAAAFFAGSGATHGTVIGSLRDLRITSFGHKSIDIAAMVCTAAGHGNPPINQVVFNTDGTAAFSLNGFGHETTEVTITLGRTDGSPEAKTIVISNAGGIRTP